MNLKNYTSTVPSSTSMAKIEKNLVAAGATDISKKYQDQICTGITFRMLIAGQMPMFFQLPAKIEPCYKVLWAEVKRPNSDTKQRVREQAERTAWKIIADWVEIQLSMILLEQAEPLQIFLPYVYDPAREQTFFDRLKENQFKGLLPESK